MFTNVSDAYVKNKSYLNEDNIIINNLSDKIDLVNVIEEQSKQHMNTIETYATSQCKCDCHCENTCHCNIFCTEINNACNINKDVNILIDEQLDADDAADAATQLLPSLKAMLPVYRKFILHMHAIKGHLNFRELISNIQTGYHDDDPELLPYSAEEIEGLKALTHYVGARSFS
jgi:hypothetical protein